jgi:soluble cytochrome b562
MKISDSLKYKKDLKNFTLAVEKVTDPKRKTYFQKLVDEFKYQIKMIDETHNSANAGKIQPSILQENLKDLTNIRYQLENLIKDIK